MRSILALLCVLATAMLPARGEEASILDKLSALKGVEREQVLLAQAKAEGFLMLYSSMQTASIINLQKAFEAKYKVSVKYWRGGSEDILRRSVVEAKAGRDDVDVFESDGPVLEAMHREALLARVASPYADELIPRRCVRTANGWRRA